MQKILFYIFILITFLCDLCALCGEFYKYSRLVGKYKFNHFLRHEQVKMSGKNFGT